MYNPVSLLYTAFTGLISLVITPPTYTLLKKAFYSRTRTIKPIDNKVDAQSPLILFSKENSSFKDEDESWLLVNTHQPDAVRMDEDEDYVVVNTHQPYAIKEELSNAISPPSKRSATHRLSLQEHLRKGIL